MHVQHLLQWHKSWIIYSDVIFIVSQRRLINWECKYKNMSFLCRAAGLTGAHTSGNSRVRTSAPLHGSGQIWSKCFLLEIFWAYWIGRKPWGWPATCWREYVFPPQFRENWGGFLPQRGMSALRCLACCHHDQDLYKTRKMDGRKIEYLLCHTL